MCIGLQTVRHVSRSQGTQRTKSAKHATMTAVNTGPCDGVWAKRLWEPALNMTRRAYRLPTEFEQILEP